MNKCRKRIKEDLDQVCEESEGEERRGLGSS